MYHELYVYHDPRLVRRLLLNVPTAPGHRAAMITKRAHQTARYWANRVYNDTVGTRCAPFHRFALPQAALDVYVGMYVDRWVVTAGRHSGLYARTPEIARPAVNPPTLPPPTLARYLSDRKGLSGDISGAIGEALFVATLRDVFHLADGDFAHLRPKDLKQFPDFTIITPSAAFQTALLNPHYPGTPILLPAEVKTVSKVEKPSDITPRIKDALVQLVSYWDIIGGGAVGGVSVVFVALLNLDQASYDLAMIYGH